MVLIEDRYVDGTNLRLRRMTDAQTEQVAKKLTKKYPWGDVRARPIVTAYLDHAQDAVLAALPANGLGKHRYKLPEGEGGFSVDVFGGRLAGLVFAERECPDAASLAALAALAAPRWAVREVTDEPHFAGGALAALGLPETV